MRADERPEPPQTADERATLAGYLDYQRATLEWKCSDLDADQLARRAQPPSTLSLLGLLRHMADVERAWFDRIAHDGDRRRDVFSTVDDPDADFTEAVASDAAVAEAFGSWRSAVAESRAMLAAASLDHTFQHPHAGALSVRWVLVHMIEEYARHNGHADLLREAIDGQTGE